MSYIRWEQRLSACLRKHSIDLLCYALAIIYFWFGILKVVGISPAEELVIRATNWIFSHEFVIVLGYWEMLVGVCLVFRKLRRIGVVLLFLQFPGTFLPLFTNPEDAFTVVPFGLTLEGQYIFKNVIIIAAGLAIIGSFHKTPNSQ